MPDPTLEQVLLHKAQRIGPDPLAGPIQNYPGALIGQVPMMGKGTFSNPVRVGAQMEPQAAKGLDRLAIHGLNDTASLTGGLMNRAWRHYTGHNLIPSPLAVINHFLGTNYGNE